MKTEQKDLLSGQHVPVLHLTDFAKNSVKLSGEQLARGKVTNLIGPVECDR